MKNALILRAMACESRTITRRDLINTISAETGLHSSQAKGFLECLLSIVHDTTKDYEHVYIKDFGYFGPKVKNHYSQTGKPVGRKMIFRFSKSIVEDICPVPDTPEYVDKNVSYEEWERNNSK